MLLFKPPKPFAPALAQAPKDTELYLHFGENKANFDQLRTRIAFLHEMLKFFPNWEQNGYSGVAGPHENEINGITLMNGQTQSEGQFYDEGIGYWSDEITGRGHNYKWRINGDDQYRYGDWHRVGQKFTIEGGETGNPVYWGYDGGTIAQNLDFSPAGWESFEGMEDAVIDANEYARLLFEGNSDNYFDADGVEHETDNDTNLGTISAAELADARAYLQNNFGDKSYYQIVMTGADGIEFLDGGTPNGLSAGWSEAEVSCDPANFLYHGTEGENGINAYYMMLNMLESRRKILYSMADIFGSPWHIQNGDNQASIDHFDNSMNETFKGVDDHNKALLLMYYQIQHSFHYVLPAYSGSATDWNGGLYTSRDIVGFKKFRDWIQAGVGQYKNSLSGAEQTRVQELYDEFTFEYAQPYGHDGRQESMQKYVGWDYISPGFDLSTNTNFEEGSRPNWINPRMQTKDSDHWMYAFSQLGGLSGAQIRGYAPFVFEGNSYDLFNTNPAINVVGTLSRARDIDEKRATEALSINQFNKAIYRRSKRAYNAAKKKEKELKYDEYIEKKIYAKRRAQTQMANNASSKKKKEIKMSYEQALEKAHTRMLGKSVNRTIQKMKQLRKSADKNRADRKRK